MKINRGHIALLAAAALSGMEDMPLPLPPLVEADVAAARRVKRETGFDTAIAMVGGGSDAQCMLLVKLAAGKILRFTAPTWAEAADAAIEGCKRYRPVQTKRKVVPMHGPENPNRKTRRMLEAQARRAK